MTDDVRWSREDVQRVLYNIVQEHEQAMAMGGDSELLRDAVRIGRQTLIDNDWWPDAEPSDVPVYTKYSDPPLTDGETNDDN